MDVAPLLRRIQEGDAQAFEQLVERYSGKALRTAYLITGQKETAEDAVQEAFIQCYLKIHSLRDPADFEAWFYRILARICWRLSAKEKKTVSLDFLSEHGQEHMVGEDCTEDALKTWETRQLLKRALSKLSIPLRTTVVLHYYNDLPIKEIARVLGEREGTIKSRLHAARRQLFDALKRIAPEFFEVSNSDEGRETNETTEEGRRCLEQAGLSDET